MNANEAIPDRSHEVRFYPKAGLYVWRGAFEDRGLPFKAGFVWDVIAQGWATSSPFIAYRLAPNLPELEWLKRRLELSWAESSDLEVPFPDGVVPHPYQRAGVEYAKDLKVSYISDEPGLGKTIQAIGVANLKNALNVLIGCPAHLRINWKREIGMFGVGDPFVTIFKGGKKQPEIEHVEGRPNYVIASYETIVKFAEKLRANGRYDLMVFDESHYLKEPTSRRSKAILGTRFQEPLTNAADQIIFLSGTPAPNKAAELWPILRATAPHLIADCKGLVEFSDRFSYFLRDDYGYSIKGSRNEDELGLRLRAGFMCRRLKSDVMKQLPPKVWKMVVWEPDSHTQRVLDKEKPFNANEIVRAGVPAGSPLADIRKEMGLAKLPLIIQYLEHLLGAGAKKVVVFAHHREVVMGLWEAMRKHGAVKVLGGLGDTTRQAAVDAFQKDDSARVFVGNIQAAGTGLTLTSSHHVVMAEASWVPGENEQAVDRCHRIGQEATSVYVHLLLVEGSLDATILGSAATKGHNIGKILDKRTRAA